MENTTLLQDYAYYLYTNKTRLNSIRGLNSGTYISQTNFIQFNTIPTPKSYVEIYFNNAKVILRREKIKKIMKR